jgi:hypothetical protein
MRLQSRNLQLRLAGASVLLGAAPATAQGVIATGSGRAGATVAALMALLGVVAGAFALVRDRRRGNGRDAAIVALVLALVGLFLAALHLATSSGGIGTGNGRLGAIVGVVLGLLGMSLGRLALARSRAREAPRDA